jgi:hypothetical protein
LKNLASTLGLVLGSGLASGAINQIKVASEIGFKYSGSNSNPGTNALIYKYTNDKTIDLNLKVLPNPLYEKAYIQQGKTLREYYLSQHPKIIFNKASKN